VGSLDSNGTSGRRQWKALMKRRWLVAYVSRVDASMSKWCSHDARSVAAAAHSSPVRRCGGVKLG
jgi:hypothetical protein